MKIKYKANKIREYYDVLTSVFPDKIQNINKKIGSITFQVTENCCMACTYCYQNHKTNNKMTFETAKVFIDKLLNDELEFYTKNDCFTIVYDFIGGEPLMEIDLIEQICEYTIKQMIELNHPWLYFIKFSIGSNGLLYNTTKVQEFFKKYNQFISFNISIDGNKELHDSCRIDLQGNGTYDRAMEAVKLHKLNYNYIPNTKMTLSPDNISYTSKALLNLIHNNYSSIMVNCAYEKGWDYSHAKILYNELKKIADYLIENDLYNKIFIRFFDEDNFSPMDEDDNDNWCGGVGHKCLALNQNGNIYPCIRYMESSLNGRQEALNIGNIFTGLLSNDKEKRNNSLMENITRRSQSTDECFYCPIAKGCSWCSAYNYEEFGTPNKRATYICCMHQATSLANVYYWNKLYKYLNIDKVFKMYLPKEKVLNIINEDEYNYLLNLSQE